MATSRVHGEGTWQVPLIEGLVQISPYTFKWINLVLELVKRFK